MAKRKSALDEAAQRAFGAENRARLLHRWFADRPAVEPGRAWEEVYRLLLWVDATTGLAHCYESDKAQPGRPWYARSLAFHVWLSDRLGVEPTELVDELDWMFRQAVRDLAAQQREGLSEKARAQREPYDGRELPEPGADPELAEIIEEELGDWLREPPPEEVWARVVTRVQAHLSQENKRRNLTGEGFEDVVVALVNRLGAGRDVRARTQVRLGDLDGFYPTREGDKAKLIDLVVENGRTGARALVTAKWSVRSDREEQFRSDFEAYTRLQSDNRPFGHVLVTNEFDPARLVRACESRAQNAPLFTDVVHVQPHGVLAAYGEASGAVSHKTQRKVQEYVEAGRLTSLDDWIAGLLD
ncbi:MAG TPA: hypothetical protein EYQ24_04120 [Bacteroidetes bacterium]|nr:hypothetical protein [Bacteroidota bacterium]HIL58452.1 hypothetical protein [Rhodothermales bacterium]